jgi:hypothetical protein
MILRALGLCEKFFVQKSDLNTQFGCRAEKLMHYSGYKSRPDWMYAGYTSPDGKTTTGWLREAELFPADRPAK